MLTKMDARGREDPVETAAWALWAGSAGSYFVVAGASAEVPQPG